MIPAIKGSSSDMHGVMTLLDVMQDPQKYKEKMAELSSKIQEYQVLVEKVGQISQIDAMHQAAIADRNTAEQILADAKKKALEIIDEANISINAKQTSLDAALVAHNTLVTNTQAQHKMKQEQLDSREAGIREKEKQLNELASQLASQKTDLEKTRAELDRKMNILSQL
jgi:chromosome segregation ATPase